MRELVLLRHAGKRMRKRRLHVNKKSIDDWEQKHENEITDDAKGAKSNCTLTFNRSIFWDKLSGRLPSISWTWRGLSLTIFRKTGPRMTPNLWSFFIHNIAKHYGGWGDAKEIISNV